MRRKWVYLVPVILVSLVLALAIVGCGRSGRGAMTPEEALLGHWETSSGDLYFRDDGMFQWSDSSGSPNLGRWSVGWDDTSTNFPATLNLDSLTTLDDRELLVTFAAGCESLEARDNSDSGGSSETWYYVDGETFEPEPEN